jgi:hypothetical protein
MHTHSFIAQNGISKISLSRCLFVAFIILGETASNCSLLYCQKNTFFSVIEISVVVVAAGRVLTASCDSCVMKETILAACLHSFFASRYFFLLVSITAFIAGAEYKRK